MKLLLVLASFVLAINAATDADLWAEFKNDYSKTYKNLLEEKLRFAIFQSNIRKIEEQNSKYESGESTYFLKINQFADLSEEEFVSTYLSYKKPKIEANTTFEIPEGFTAPDDLDWRAKNAVLAVKNQGHCGSCWAFSTTGALEGQNAIKNSKRVSLSEEQLVDCSKDNAGCEGGDMNLAFKYVQQNGISTESSYPYTASGGKAGTCKTGTDSGIKVTGYTDVKADENALKAAVASVGPISIAINGDAIQLYGGGIFNRPFCSKKLDHGVLAVGYGTQGSHAYWIVKNSWGTTWGERGYIKMTRNAFHQCGIGLENSYPNIA